MYAIAHVGGLTYVGGIFTAAGPPGGPLTPRANLAVLDDSGALAPIAPVVDGQVNAIAADGARVFIGGTFAHVNGLPRNTIAALDAATGTTTPFHPDASADKGAPPHVQTRALAFAAGTRFAAIDTPRGVLTEPRNLDAPELATNGYVISLAQSGDRLYAGGAFTTAGPTNLYQRQRLFAFNAAGGIDAAFAPSINSDVYALVTSGANLYVGGTFTQVNGSPRNHVALLDGETGTLLPFNPNPNGYVRALALSGSTLYAGGGFTQIGGQPRNRIAGIDVASGQPTAFDPSADGDVLALHAAGPVVYAGGHFTQIGGQERGHYAQFREPPATGGGGPGTGPAGGTGTPGGGGGGAARDLTAPRLSAVSLSRRRFKVARTAVATPGRGTTLRFTSSEAGDAVVGIQRPLRGRRSGGACVTPARAPRGARRCTLWSTLGSFARKARSGRNAVGFSGRLPARTLRAGQYRFRLTVTDALGNRSVPRTITFEVVSA